MEVLIRAGFIINLTKSEPCPSQDLVFIGGRLRTDLGMEFLPPKRVEALLACVRTFLQVSQYQPAHQFLRLLGLMASCLSVVRFARLYMRPIQWHVKDCWAPPLRLQAPVMVTRALVSDLQWWLHLPNLERGLKLQPPVPELAGGVFSRRLRVLGRQTRWLRISISWSHGHFGGRSTDTSPIC